MKTVWNRRVRAAGTLGVLVLMLASSCGRPGAVGDGPPPSGRQLTNIVAGVVSDETNTSLFVAQQHGFFAAHGLHVTIKSIVSTQDAVPELLDNSINLAAGQLPTWLTAQSKGLGPFRVLAPGVQLSTDVDEIITLGTSQISSAGQLRGLTIGVNAAAGNGPLLTDNVLSTYGITPADVTYKVVPFADIASALASHQVVAAYCTEPWCTLAAQQLGATSIADMNQGFAQGIMIGGYTVTAAWLKKNPRTAAEFVASIDEAINLANTNVGVVWHAFAALLNVSPQVASLLKIGVFPPTVTTNDLLQLASLMAQYGELRPGTNLNALATALVTGK